MNLHDVKPGDEVETLRDLVCWLVGAFVAQVAIRGTILIAVERTGEELFAELERMPNIAVQGAGGYVN